LRADDLEVEPVRLAGFHVVNQDLNDIKEEGRRRGDHGLARDVWRPGVNVIKLFFFVRSMVKRKQKLELLATLSGLI